MNKINFVLVFATISIVAGKYDIELQSFETLPASSNIDVIDPRTFRMKQEHRNSFVLTGTLEVKRNFGPSDTIKFEYHQKTQIGRYLKLFATSMPLCDVTKLNYYPKLLEVSNLPPPNTCPMRKANYTINNLIIDESFFPSVLPTGENFVITQIFVDNKPVYGAKLNMNIRQV